MLGFGFWGLKLNPTNQKTLTLTTYCSETGDVAQIIIAFYDLSELKFQS